MIDCLQTDVPSNPQDLESFFAPDLSSVATTEQRRLFDNAENLRKTVVDHRGTMPIGCTQMDSELREITKACIRWNFRCGVETICDDRD